MSTIHRMCTMVLMVCTLTLCATTMVHATPSPTGHTKCDQYLTIHTQVLRDMGWTLDCTPDVGTLYGANGRPLVGAVIPDGRNVVYVWPQYIPTPALLQYVAWHEIGHAVNPSLSEEDTDAWAWCMAPVYQARNQYDRIPTHKECSTLTGGVRPYINTNAKEN